MDHQELRQYFDSNKREWRSEVDDFYSGLREIVRKELEGFESEVEATIVPPNVCVFGPVESLEKRVVPLFDEIETVSEAEFLAAMSIFLGSRKKELFSDDLVEMCFYFRNESRDHKIAKIANYLSREDRNDRLAYYNYIGRFFPQYNYFALNYFEEAQMPEDVPEFMRPARRFLRGNGNNVSEVISHEMTHAYIYNKSDFSSYTKEIYSVDEAAAQAVTNVFEADSTPSNRYYDEKNKISQEVMQAAREVFLSSANGKDKAESVSTIRSKAVEAVNKIVAGEDPVRALREEDDYRSRIVRIASYATKRMAGDVKRDLAIVGMNTPYLDVDIGEKHDRIKDLTEVQGDLREINKIGKNLDEMARNQEVKKSLIKETEELSIKSKDIKQIIRMDFTDGLSDEADISVLDDIFGEQEWTDPVFPGDDVELTDRLLWILRNYHEVVDTAAKRAGKIESAAKFIHEEGRELLPRYQNEKAVKNVKLLLEETEKLYKEIDDVRKSLEQAEEMTEVAINKIQELEDQSNSA